MKAGDTCSCLESAHHHSGGGGAPRRSNLPLYTVYRGRIKTRWHSVWDYRPPPLPPPPPDTFQPPGHHKSFSCRGCWWGGGGGVRGLVGGGVGDKSEGTGGNGGDGTRCEAQEARKFGIKSIEVKRKGYILKVLKTKCSNITLFQLKQTFH
jgi:hypothetical protein